jgi:hypothetical protein
LRKEVEHRVKKRNVLHTITGSIGDILRGNCTLKQAIEGKIEERL